MLDSIDEFDDGRTELLSDPDAFVHVFHDNPTAHLEDRRWALEYWRRERASEPTENAAKCRSCPFADVCPGSLA